MKKTILYSAILVFLLIGFMLVKTMIHPFGEVPVANPDKNSVPKLTELQLSHISQGLKIPTVSQVDYKQTDFAPFQEFISFLKKSYPKIFQSLEFVTVNEYGLIFHWKGSNPDLKPILFLSHYDVVAPGDPELWDAGAFSGKVMDSKIYGRGALDMKNMLLGLLESVEILLDQGFVPKRSVYFAFGQDEEVGGREGADRIAKYFQEKKIEFDAVYDEGGIVAKQGSVPGINSHIALIGVAEKGFLSARIQVKGLGGHSSMPPMESAMGKAAQIMLNLEKNQFPSRIIPSIAYFLDQIGGAMSFPIRMGIANRWILEPILLSKFSKTPATNAITRTTTALTMMKGSDGTNVLSPEVEIVVNFRLLPGDSVEDVRNHIQKATQGYDVEIEEVSNTRDPSRISSTESQGYKVMESTIKKVYPSAIVTPYITIAGTDACKYEFVSENIYRFNPVLLSKEEQRSIHNNNEYITVDNYARTIQYFTLMMKEYDGDSM